MTDTAAVQAFIRKWENNALNEAANSKEHFIDLCKLLGQKTPNEADPRGTFYRFEKPLTKAGGGAGFADVWRQDRFAWEYKSKGKYLNLRAAYQQLLLYKSDLDNPPVLVACDIANYEVHIEFTGYKSRVETFTNADLQNEETRKLLRLVFTDPEQLRPVERASTITEKAAGRFAEVAQFLERRGFAPSQIAPFFMKILFALFAEDIKLLPAELMSKSLKLAVRNPQEFPGRARALFRAMKDGDFFGMERVPQFNGGLFVGDDVLPLNADELTFLADAARLDWSEVEPAIFGTLFERSLDPAKRAQLGAHYTSRDDILLIVEPVLMQPLRREWETAKEGIEALRQQWETQTGNARRRLQSVAEGMLYDFMERLSQVKVLDPACGSGNFLYVALTQLKDLEQEVWVYAGGLGLAQPDLGVSPKQLYGVEKNQFAAELAQVVVWIGHLQWLRKNGHLEGVPHEPILQTLHNIECRDAILGVDLHGNPVEPEWPTADVIIGNPPFLGGSKLRRELGDTYTETLWQLYEGRIPGAADLVCYWFERAREQIAHQKTKRAGLLATQSIRAGASRKVLEHIKQSGNIFMGWSDRPWVLDGAAVRVSMIGFDDGTETLRQLNSHIVGEINADLTSVIDLTSARSLLENRNICFLGMMKGGPFDIDMKTAEKLLQVNTNLNGKPNSDVVKPRMNAKDITTKWSRTWIIDFADMSLEEAKLYKEPFEYVVTVVKPVRDTVRDIGMKTKWWLQGRSRPALREAIKDIQRYIVTPRVAKHRIFVWLEHPILPDHKLCAIAREDDFFFGVLQSRSHEIWSLITSSRHGDGDEGGRPTYTPTTCFETYPFPWPPGKEPKDDPRVEAIADAARELIHQRDEWLNPQEVFGVNLKERTLTNLYNKRPDWLTDAHKKLDAAVFDAYGWPHDLSDDEILARLLALNLERAAKQGDAPAAATEAEEDDE